MYANREENAVIRYLLVERLRRRLHAGIAHVHVSEKKKKKHACNLEHVYTFVSIRVRMPVATKQRAD